VTLPRPATTTTCSYPLSSFPKIVEQTPSACAFFKNEREKGELKRRLNSCRHGRSKGLEPVGRNQ